MPACRRCGRKRRGRGEPEDEGADGDACLDRAAGLPEGPHGAQGEAASASCASDGHDYPYPDGIPVLVVDDVEPTQPGYWAKPEQIERVRAAEPPAIEGDQVDPYVAPS